MCVCEREKESNVPYPPRITFAMSRFMASHIIYVRIPPENPIKDPTLVIRALSRRNPSAASAHPEYEFRTVITTGISAPPIEEVMCHPMNPQSALVHERIPRPAFSVCVCEWDIYTCTERERERESVCKRITATTKV